MVKEATARPIKILIGAMGGEGGGVMTKWMTALGESQNHQVRYTYVPGVAQRTGATIYYLELWPVVNGPDGDRPMVGALMPCPGDVDLLLSTEPVETGRALQLGYVTKARTAVISSTHRVYAIAEKSAPIDGRIDTTTMLGAIDAHCRRFIRFDMAACAGEAGSIINAVLFGALAGSGILPFPREAFVAAIEDGSAAAGANLRGFEKGFSVASGEDAGGATQAPAPPARTHLTAGELAAMENAFPPAVHEILRLGMEKLADYQDAGYARSYLERLGPVLKVDLDSGGAAREHALTGEVGRWLARLMAYDDVIRVADLKTRRRRFERVHGEVRAETGQVVRVTDYLKPGIGEMVSVLSPAMARRVLAFSKRTGFGAKGFAMKLKTSTITGFVIMRMIARMRHRRRRSYRFAEEQAAIETWLQSVLEAAGRNYDLALEVAACARLVKGYGPTHCRGADNFAAIVGRVPGADSKTIRRLRQAATADETGAAMAAALAESPTSEIASGANSRKE